LYTFFDDFAIWRTDIPHRLKSLLSRLPGVRSPKTRASKGPEGDQTAAATGE
jgi:hypothetical protein